MTDERGEGGRRCGACKKELREGAAFCTNCGKPAFRTGGGRVRPAGGGASRTETDPSPAQSGAPGEVQREVTRAHLPRYAPFVCAHPTRYCMDRIETFMVGEGFSVQRGGSTATFSRMREVNWAVFLVLLVFGVLPGLVYLLGVQASPLHTTLLTSSTGEGTELVVRSEDESDAALLEGWIEENLAEDRPGQ